MRARSDSETINNNHEFNWIQKLLKPSIESRLEKKQREKVLMINKRWNKRVEIEFWASLSRQLLGAITRDI